MNSVAPGYRWYPDGVLNGVGDHGASWSSAVSDTYGVYLRFVLTALQPSYPSYRSHGFQVRCLQAFIVTSRSLSLPVESTDLLIFGITETALRFSGVFSARLEPQTERNDKFSSPLIPKFSYSCEAPRTELRETSIQRLLVPLPAVRSSRPGLPRPQQRRGGWRRQ